MVCAESSASFSKTVALMMSSLGEATDRVTSILEVGQACEVRREFQGAAAARAARGCAAAVQYWYSRSGCGHWPWPDCSVGAQARCGCPVGGAGTGRPAAARRQPPALASGGTARLTQRSPGAQKWRQLRVKQPSARKLGSVARGPSAHRPGAATPPAHAPKNAPEGKVQ